MKRIAVWFIGCALGWGTAAAQTQKGGDIDGLSEWAQTGSAVSMPNDVTLAIGEPGALATQGRVRVYRWNGLEWVQAGMDLVGDGSSEQFGFSVSMGDENTVAVGAPHEGTGRTRVFTLLNARN